MPTSLVWGMFWFFQAFLMTARRRQCGCAGDVCLKVQLLGELGQADHAASFVAEWYKGTNGDPPPAVLSVLILTVWSGTFAVPVREHCAVCTLLI